ncbi:glycine-rich protein DOT1-like [Choloepus didactylus]|uniref:glycine-rich protein DOT1-like n=1 Tax=Choloepus didactylus TaxID=27675 RepID=UPI00189D048F|nr:glycine-rich protein DOT1-like [Choloepus didactylus]
MATSWMDVAQDTARLCSTSSPLGEPESAHGPDQKPASGRELEAKQRSQWVRRGDCSGQGLRRLPCEERTQGPGAGRGLGGAAARLHLPLGSRGTEARAAARLTDAPARGSAPPFPLGQAPGSPGGEGGGRSQAGGSGQARGSGGGGERTPDTGQASGHGAAGKMTAGSCSSSWCSRSPARSGSYCWSWMMLTSRWRTSMAKPSF